MANCVVCGGAATDCHEILAGSHRHKAFVEPACWLAVCRLCHDQIQGSPVPRQLAYKLLYDPFHFDMAAFEAAWGRAVEWSDVVSNLHQLLTSERRAA